MLGFSVVALAQFGTWSTFILSAENSGQCTHKYMKKCVHVYMASKRMCDEMRMRMSTSECERLWSRMSL